MSLTFGPKKFDVAVGNAANVKVFDRTTHTPATLSSPVTITADGSVTFTVATPGHYVVEINEGQVGITEKVFLTNAEPYDITDPRSYANSAPAVAGGGGGSSTVQNVVIGPDAPVAGNVPQLWVETDGTGAPISLWLETGN